LLEVRFRISTQDTHLGLNKLYVPPFHIPLKKLEFYPQPEFKQKMQLFLKLL